MGARGRMKRDLKELRRLERICLAEAGVATMCLERIGLLKVAEDCRSAANEIEFSGRSQLYGGMVDSRTLISRVAWAGFLTGRVLFVALYLPW